MSVGESKKKQQTQQNTKKPKPKQKNQPRVLHSRVSSSSLSRLSRITLYPAPFYSPPTPVMACVGPACSECRLPSLGLLLGIPFTGPRFPASWCVPLDLELDTSCQKSACACSHCLQPLEERDLPLCQHGEIKAHTTRKISVSLWQLCGRRFSRCLLKSWPDILTHPVMAEGCFACPGPGRCSMLPGTQLSSQPAAWG